MRGQLGPSKSTALIAAPGRASTGGGYFILAKHLTIRVGLRFLNHLQVSFIGVLFLYAIPPVAGYSSTYSQGRAAPASPVTVIAPTRFFLVWLIYPIFVSFLHQIQLV